jgi:Xaa-Pro aminopeptidase
MGAQNRADPLIYQDSPHSAPQIHLHSPMSSPLLYACPETSADALYFGRVSAPDPFIAFGVRGRRIAVVSALEFSRIRRDSAFDAVLPLEIWAGRAARAWPGRGAGVAGMIVLLARKYRVGRFTVPEDFPAGIFERLRRLGARVSVADGPLFPGRIVKTRAEANALREGNRCSALGIAAAERMLRASRIRGGRLFHGGVPLTSERLRFAVDRACLAAGAAPGATIVAGGDQACDPHHRGSGPLRANDLIVVDVFPRVGKTGYHGDMTRTFLRGRASAAQRALVAAVRAAQQAALGAIRAGVPGRDVHAKVTGVFSSLGYRTKRTSRGSVGFFHGTGHGLGLDIHEAPRINGSAEAGLPRGCVVTVEPGLYYPGLGGCRIEDVVQVTDGAPRMLSDFHYTWELS